MALFRVLRRITRLAAIGLLAAVCMELDPAFVGESASDSSGTETDGASNHDSDDDDSDDDDSDDDDSEDDDSDDDDADDDDSDDDDSDDDDSGDDDSDDDDLNDDDDATGDSSTGDDDSPINVAFVTSSTFRVTDLGGLAGADARCTEAATAAGLGGTSYRAWLSTPSVDAKDRFSEAIGWVRTDGRPIAITLDAVPSELFWPLDHDEFGTRVLDALVWTGTAMNGRVLTDWDVSICGAWTSANGERVEAGESGGGTRRWTQSAQALDCTEQARLYCLGVDYVHAPVPPQEVGRHVFVTASHVPATTDRLAANALCQQEADAAGLDGGFAALRAEPGMAPIDGFDLDGPAWVRVDGVPIFADGDVMGTVVAAPISLDASGWTNIEHRAWMGSLHPAELGTVESTCQGWTSTAGESSLASAQGPRWFGWESYTGAPECEGSYPLICFER